MPVIRGEVCIGVATFLSFVSLVLLIFVHVSQLNTTTIPRGIAMVKMNVSQYGNGIFIAQSDPVDGLYTQNATAPLQQEAGLRQLYAWGFYSYCAYTAPDQGICSNTTIGHKVLPFETMLADVPFRYQTETEFIVPSSTFKDGGFLGSLSRGGYYLCLVGTVLTALSMIIGVKKGNLTFFLASIFSILATLMILTSASIWTSVVAKARVVNAQQIPVSAPTKQPVPLGITVTPGTGLWLLWSSFATLFVSTIPYVAR